MRTVCGCCCRFLLRPGPDVVRCTVRPPITLVRRSYDIPAVFCVCLVRVCCSSLLPVQCRTRLFCRVLIYLRSPIYGEPATFAVRTFLRRYRFRSVTRCLPAEPFWTLLISTHSGTSLGSALPYFHHHLCSAVAWFYDSTGVPFTWVLYSYRGRWYAWVTFAAVFYIAFADRWCAAPPCCGIRATDLPLLLHFFCCSWLFRAFLHAGLPA